MSFKLPTFGDLNAPVVFGLALDKADEVVLQRILSPHLPALVTSLSPIFDGTLAFDALIRPAHPYLLPSFAEAQDRVVRFAPGVWGHTKPTAAAELKVLLAMEPETQPAWSFRAAALTALTRTLFFVVDEQSTRNVDLAAQVTFARSVDALVVGVLPRDLRKSIDSAVLTMCNAIIGEQDDGRALMALLRKDSNDNVPKAP